MKIVPLSDDSYMIVFEENESIREVQYHRKRERRCIIVTVSREKVVASDKEAR